ncbi:1197_t:CDS:2, partial [Gigaspora rosea]
SIVCKKSPEINKHQLDILPCKLMMKAENKAILPDTDISTTLQPQSYYTPLIKAEYGFVQNDNNFKAPNLTMQQQIPEHILLKLIKYSSTALLKNCTTLADFSNAEHTSYSQNIWKEQEIIVQNIPQQQNTKHVKSTNFATDSNTSTNIFSDAILESTAANGKGVAS